MMLHEFESRTGFYPSSDLYSLIEKAYMESNLDKDAFCKAYKTNADGLAEKIQRAANTQSWKEHDAISQERKGLTAQIETLKQQLDKEQEWKLYEIEQNVKQADYEKLAEGAADGKWSHYMTDEEAIQWICDEFDFDPAKVTIIHEVDEYEINRHRQLRKTGRKIDRRPIYCATDYHYIRFNTSRFYYEVWNDSLQPYYC